MRTAATVLSIIHERGKRGLPVEDLYRQLYNPDLYLRAYARLYHHDGFVANFAQEVVKGQLPLSEERLSGQGVEQFSRSEVLVSLFDHHLPFLDHVHEFDADERGLRRVKRFEP
jgi:hypothetical protein